MTNLPDNSKITYTIAEKDQAGFVMPTNPSDFDSPPSWVSSNPDAFQAVPSVDGMSCDVVAVGDPSDATKNSGQIQMTCIVKGQPFTGTDDITIVNSGFGSVAIVPGQVQPK